MSHPDDQLLAARASLKPSTDRAKSPSRGTASTVLTSEALFGHNLSSSTLSFLTPAKAQEYKDLFDDAGPVLPRFASERGFLEHEKALAEMKKTGCPDDVVQMIWALCNVSPSPGYTLPEFCLAMHLAEQAARNPDSDQIPTLDDTIIREVQIASGYTPPEPKPTTGHSPNSSARPPVVMPEPGAARPLRPEVQTGRAKDAENPFRAMMRSGESPNVQTVVDVVEQGPISAEGLRKADDLFGALKGEDGYMDGLTVKDLFQQYSLPDSTLAQAWDLCSRTVPGKLTRGEFRVAVHLVDELGKGVALPSVLEPGLVAVLRG